MKLSIRNAIKGKIAAMTEGMAVATVKVDIGGGKSLTSVVTMDAVKDLGLKVGDDITVLVKATSVMLAKD
ncbi:MAG: TOBE domain-containing protein [Desulfomonilaceae bacterium]